MTSSWRSVAEWTSSATSASATRAQERDRGARQLPRRRFAGGDQLPLEVEQAFRRRGCREQLRGGRTRRRRRRCFDQIQKSRRVQRHRGPLRSFRTF
jgi:hypothetical protein